MDASTLVQAINETTANHDSVNESQKAQLVDACTTLIASLESPTQKLMAMLFAPVTTIALRLGIDMHLFDVSAKALETNENVTLQHLSSETKCDALLIRRIMRILIEMKIFKEIDQEVFQPQPIMALYKTDSVFAQAIIHFTSHELQIFTLPDYFAEKGYLSPNDAFHSPFQYAMRTDLHVFDWVAARPKLQHAFNVTMSISQQVGDSKWYELFPVERYLAKDTPSNTFMVDLGGGLGHHLIDFKEHQPDLQGKLILQDIAPVIDRIDKLPSGIEAMTHDFFKPQPVRLAKIYFLAHIVHDWPDKQAKTILENVRDAMGPDSVILLSETIMPERNVPLVPAMMDMIMMAAFSSLERTEKQFRNLLDDAGLELVQVWKPKQADPHNPRLGTSILEARLRL